MYSQLGNVSPNLLRAVNGSMGRPYSLLSDFTDGNMPSRVRSMSELPSKGRKNKPLDMLVGLLFY